jgi:hypothetical protein
VRNHQDKRGQVTAAPRDADPPSALEALRRDWHRATHEERITFLRLIRIEDAQVPVPTDPETRPRSE